MPPIRLPSSPRRILLIKPSAIGDVVQSLPVLALLRGRFPEAHIAWLISNTCANLIEGHPLLDEVILFQRRQFANGWRSPASARRLIEFMKDLRRREFDLVLDLQGLFRSGWFAWKTHAPVRIGFSAAREFASIFYTHRIDVGSKEQHAVDRYLQLAAAAGCERAPVEFPFHITEDDRAAVAAMIPGTGRYVVLAPGTNWPTKRWPVDRFAALLRPLREQFALSAVVAGAPAERDLAERVGGINLAGRTTLRQLAALIEGAELVIANDSGPMHIAAALNRPLVALFGPTNPVRTGPYGRQDAVLRLNLPCSPCYSRACTHQSCLQWLTIAPVLELAQRQMELHGMGRSAWTSRLPSYS